MSNHNLFLSRNKKNNVYPFKPQFYYLKWGLRESKLRGHVFVMNKKNINIFRLKKGPYLELGMSFSYVTCHMGCIK